MRQGAEAVQRCENGVLAPQAVAQTEWGVPTAEAAIAAATSACMGVGINGKEIFCLPVLGQGPDYQMDFLKLEVTQFFLTLKALFHPPYLLDPYGN